MDKFFKLYKLILQTLFLYILLFTSSSVGLEKYYRGDSVSNYFSGIISSQQNKHDKSYGFLKNLENLEDRHSKYSVKYIETLVNNSKINEAFRYSEKLKKKEMNFFYSDIIALSKFIKNDNFYKADNYLVSLQKNNYSLLQELLNQIIFSWVQIEKSKLNYNEAKEIFQLISPEYKNLKKINNVFLNCYFDTSTADQEFQKLINDSSDIV